MGPPRSNRPLRVAVDATPLFGQVTGVGGVTRSILKRLSSRPNLEVTPYVVSWRAQSLLASGTADGLTGANVRALKFPARAAHRLWQHANWPQVGGFDLVHGTNFVVPPGGQAAELVTVHDLTAWHMPELVSKYSLAYPKLVARAVQRGAHVHVVSNAVAAEVRSIIDVDPDKVHAIPNGFDAPSVEGASELAALAEAGKRLAGGPYVLCLGTIEPRKDHPSLLQAMRNVWSTLPNLKLVVAGADGWGAEAFDRALVDYGLGDDKRFIRLGYVSDADRLRLLAGAECLAYPSLYEGFGLPPLEAMALDTPVVATNIAALAEVCGDAAVLVPTRDPDSLAEAMLTVLIGDRPDLLEAGRTQVKIYSWDTMVDQLVDLYRSLSAEAKIRS